MEHIHPYLAYSIIALVLGSILLSLSFIKSSIDDLIEKVNLKMNNQITVLKESTVIEALSHLSKKMDINNEKINDLILKLVKPLNTVTVDKPKFQSTTNNKSK